MKKLLLFGTVFLALVLVTSPAWGMTKDQLVARVAAKTGKSTTTQGESAVEAAVFKGRFSEYTPVEEQLKGSRHWKADGDNIGLLIRGIDKKKLKMATGDNLGFLLRGVDKETRRGKVEWKDWFATIRSADSGNWMKIMKARMADSESGGWMKIMKSRRMKQGKRAVLDIVEGESKAGDLADITLRMNKAQLIDSMAKDAKLTKTETKIPAKKVVKFKAGSDLSKTVA